MEHEYYSESILCFLLHQFIKASKWFEENQKVPEYFDFEIKYRGNGGLVSCSSGHPKKAGRGCVYCIIHGVEKETKVSVYFSYDRKRNTGFDLHIRKDNSGDIIIKGNKLSITDLAFCYIRDLIEEIKDWRNS